MWGFVAGTAASIGSSIWNAGQQKKENKRARQFAVDRYNVERGHALEDWHRINAYNTPQAQRERMEAAGMNPALMYGGNAGGGNAAQARGSSTSSPPTKAAKLDPFDYISLQKASAETRAIKAQAESQEIENVESRRDLNRVATQNTGTGAEREIIKWAGASGRKHLREINQIALLEEQKAYTRAQKDRIDQEVQLIKEKVAELARLNRWHLVRGINWQQDLTGIGRELLEALNIKNKK